MSFSSCTYIYMWKIIFDSFIYLTSLRQTRRESFRNQVNFPITLPWKYARKNSQETNDLKIRVSRLSESLEFVTYKEHSNSRRNNKNIAICRQINHFIQKMRAAFFKA